MAQLVYTEEHEYVQIESGQTRIGISAYAQDQLGDIVFVELPDVGSHFEKGDEIAVVESVKAASEIYAPLACTITRVNLELAGDPGLINRDPMGAGWLIEVKLDDPQATARLMDETAYAAHAQ